MVPEYLENFMNTTPDYALSHLSAISSSDLTYDLSWEQFIIFAVHLHKTEDT